MKFVFKGKFKSEDQLPVKEHPAGAVQFKEAADMKKLALYANAIAVVVMLLCFFICFFRGRTVFKTGAEFFDEGYFGGYIGLIASLIFCVPHEFLHAVCFRDEVQMYTNLKKGMLFVVGTEDMSRTRFIFMSMLPNIVFGILPMIVYIIFPRLTFFAGLGIFATGAGGGDYMNVVNCVTQVPKGALVYMSGIHSYWYERG